MASGRVPMTMSVFTPHKEQETRLRHLWKDFHLKSSFVREINEGRTFVVVGSVPLEKCCQARNIVKRFGRSWFKHAREWYPLPIHNSNVCKRLVSFDRCRIPIGALGMKIALLSPGKIGRG